MRLRITNKGHVEHEAKATDRLETLFEQAALKLVERFDPLNAAYYSYYKRDFDNARRIVRVYLTDPSPKDDSEWAENLLGLLEYARYRRDDARAEAGLDKAIVQLRKLRQSEPKFAPGLYNLAYVLTDKGRKRQAAGETEAAKTYFNEAHAVAREGIRCARGAGQDEPRSRGRLRHRRAGAASARPLGEGQIRRGAARLRAEHRRRSHVHPGLCEPGHDPLQAPRRRQGHRRLPARRRAQPLAADLDPRGRGAAAERPAQGVGADVRGGGRARALGQGLHLLGHGVARRRTAMRKRARSSPRRSRPIPSSPTATTSSACRTWTRSSGTRPPSSSPPP